MYDTIIPHYGLSQFGFRKGSSTSCALLALHDDLTKFLDIPNTVGVSIISFDASKAFDSVCHNQLLSVLSQLHLPTGFITWIRDYLDNRFQYVETDGQVSDLRPVTSGVPQGAILSPVLFCSFIASIKSTHPSTKIYKYADDLILALNHYKSENDESICANEIQILLIVSIPSKFD